MRRCATTARRALHHDAIGFNYRMDGFQGAVLRIKLARLDAWNREALELARSTGTCSPVPASSCPRTTLPTRRVYHVFAVCVDDRDAVRAALEARGIGTGIHYPIPPPPAGVRALGFGRGRFPHAERACDAS